MASIKDKFVFHASLAFFASAWADLVEENGGIIRGEVMDIMPRDIDPAATHAARTLAMDIERANGKTILQLMRYIEQNGDGDRPNWIDYFGHYAAMQAIGHGVGLSDAFGREVREAIKVPYIEFGMHNLERDYQ